MSLTTVAPAATTGFTYALTDESGIIISDYSSDIQTTQEDMVYDPSDGKLALYGNHCDESPTGSLNGVIAGTTGLAADSVGDTVTVANDLSILGHDVSTGHTTVLTGGSITHTLGQFLRVTLNVRILPFTTS